MDLYLIVFLLIATIIFILVILESASNDRCPYPGGKCFDGNGRYQYKGRGHKDESVSRLLNRIDWLAKNSINKPLYTSSYIIAYALSLAIILILYAYGDYLISVWEYILILLAAFIITFSINNLLNFHTDRYPNYYIRENIHYIKHKLYRNDSYNTNGDNTRYGDYDPGHPCRKSSVPHRTKVCDRLFK